jgi:hypothetical protein
MLRSVTLSRNSFRLGVHLLVRSLAFVLILPAGTRGVHGVLVILVVLLIVVDVGGQKQHKQQRLSVAFIRSGWKHLEIQEAQAPDGHLKHSSRCWGQLCIVLSAGWIARVVYVNSRTTLKGRETAPPLTANDSVISRPCLLELSCQYPLRTLPSCDFASHASTAGFLSLVDVNVPWCPLLSRTHVMLHNEYQQQAWSKSISTIQSWIIVTIMRTLGGEMFVFLGAPTIE